MRFSTPVILALPLLAKAAESPFDQYKAQFQNFLGSFGSKPPSPSKEEPVEAPPTEIVEKKIETLTLENWNETLFSPVKPDAIKPEEWWVLITGRNKTCFGHCLKVELAFNESAPKFAVLPQSPHMAVLNCEDQPVLCNSWSAGTGSLWVFEMLPAPAPIDIYYKRLNLTTTTSDTLLDLYATESKDSFKLHDGWFHPYNGPLAQNGLSIPAGYFFWVFNAIPSWAMMIFVSFISRTMMNRRMDNNYGNRRNPGAAPRAAPPGDARS